MNINYTPTQYQLFPSNSATLENEQKPKFLLANLTLSLESLVILTILVIMIGLFAFSLGVERGKHLTAQALDERVGAAWNLAPHKPMLPVTMIKPIVAVKSALIAVRTMPVNSGNVTAIRQTTAKQAVVPALSMRFTITVASYRNEAYAKQDALGLKAKGLQSFLIKKGDFWLLCVGQYPSKENAETAVKRLQPKYKNLSIRRF